MSNPYKEMSIIGLMPTKGRPQQALVNASRMIQFAGVPFKIIVLHDESENAFWSEVNNPNIETESVPSSFHCAKALAHGLQIAKSTHMALICDDYLCSWNWLRCCVMTSTVGIVSANVGSGWTHKFSAGLAEMSFLEYLYGPEKWPTCYYHFCVDDEIADRAKYFNKYSYQPHAVLYHMNGDLGFADYGSQSKFDHEKEDLAKYFARKEEFEIENMTTIERSDWVFPFRDCNFEERDTACLNEGP